MPTIDCFKFWLSDVLTDSNGIVWKRVMTHSPYYAELYDSCLIHKS